MVELTSRVGTVGCGDVITPGPVEMDYPVLLDHAVPRLRAYTAGTVVAEQFEALTTMGAANSRLKDLYALRVIAQTFEFSESTMVSAIKRTIERRGTAMPIEMPSGLTDEFAAAKTAQWRAFLRREQMAAVPDDLHKSLPNLASSLCRCLPRRAISVAGHRPVRGAGQLN